MRWLLLSLIVSAAQAQPRRGDAAPDPGIDTFLNAPADASWGDTFGQAVVMDFWATWCAPCVASIPHLNAVADSLAGRPVVFVALTEEDAATVAPFLARRPIHGWVGLDPDSSGVHAFGVSAIPQTALIGRDGRLAAVVHPTQVTVAMIDSLLAGIPLNRPDRPSAFLDSLMALARRPMPAASADAVTEVRWMLEGERPPFGSWPGRPIDPERREARWNGDLKLLFYLSPLDPPPGNEIGGATLVGPDSLLRRRASIHIVAPDLPEEAFRPYVFDVLSQTLGITVRDEVRTIPVLRLRQSEGGMRLPPSSGDARTSGAEGVISASGATLAQIARSLETCLETPVVDETGAEGTYSLHLLLDPTVVDCDRASDAQTEAVRQALREEAGLDLVPGVAVRPVIVVAP